MNQAELRGLGVVDELSFLNKKDGSKFFNNITESIVHQIRKLDLEERERLFKINAMQKKNIRKLD